MLWIMGHHDLGVNLRAVDENGKEMDFDYQPLSRGGNTMHDWNELERRRTKVTIAGCRQK